MNRQDLKNRLGQIGLDAFNETRDAINADEALSHGKTMWVLPSAAFFYAGCKFARKNWYTPEGAGHLQHRWSLKCDDLTACLKACREERDEMIRKYADECKRSCNLAVEVVSLAADRRKLEAALCDAKRLVREANNKLSMKYDDIAALTQENEDLRNEQPLRHRLAAAQKENLRLTAAFDELHTFIENTITV